MATILSVLFRLVMLAIEIYEIALLVYFLLSWFPNARQSGLWGVLERICEPYVGFFRQFIPAIGGISFAGIFALLVLTLLRRGFAVIFRFLISWF